MAYFLSATVNAIKIIYYVIVYLTPTYEYEFKNSFGQEVYLYFQLDDIKNV